MKQLIEIFMWQYEGEYEQYFFVVDEEETFIKEVMTYLNTEQVKQEFPWSNPLGEFKEEQQVSGNFLTDRIQHLKDTYFLDFDYGTNFHMVKRTTTFESKKVI